jgi:hypothetical protein
MNMIVDHLAVLVKSVAHSAEGLRRQGIHVNSPEDFPGEGTRECYVGDPALLSRLLLIEATGEGPYLRALQKRGPGVHHFGLQSQNLEADVEYILGLGYGIRDRYENTVWLAKKGLPLVELHGQFKQGLHMINGVRLPMTPDQIRDVHFLGLRLEPGPLAVQIGENLTSWFEVLCGLE